MGGETMTGALPFAADEEDIWLNAWKCSAERGVMLQDVGIERGPGALTLLREADTGCLSLACFRLDLDLSLCAAIDVWTASVTHKPYALDPDFDL